MLLPFLLHLCRSLSNLLVGNGPYQPQLQGDSDQRQPTSPSAQTAPSSPSYDHLAALDRLKPVHSGRFSLPSGQLTSSSSIAALSRNASASYSQASQVKQGQPLEASNPAFNSQQLGTTRLDELQRQQQQEQHAGFSIGAVGRSSSLRVAPPSPTYTTTTVRGTGAAPIATSTSSSFIRKVSKLGEASVAASAAEGVSYIVTAAADVPSAVGGSRYSLPRHVSLARQSSSATAAGTAGTWDPRVSQIGPGAAAGAVSWAPGSPRAQGSYSAAAAALSPLGLGVQPLSFLQLAPQSPRGSRYASMRMRNDFAADTAAREGAGVSRVSSLQKESCTAGPRGAATDGDGLGAGSSFTRDQQQQWLGNQQEQQQEPWQEQQEQIQHHQQHWQSMQGQERRHMRVEEQRQFGMQDQMQPQQQQQQREREAGEVRTQAPWQHQQGLQQHEAAQAQVDDQQHHQEQHGYGGAYGQQAQQRLKQPKHFHDQLPWKQGELLDGGWEARVEEQQQGGYKQPQHQQQQQQRIQQTQQIQGARTAQQGGSAATGQHPWQPLPQQAQQQQRAQHQDEPYKQLHQQLQQQQAREQVQIHPTQQLNQQVAEVQEVVPLVELNPSQRRSAAGSSQHQSLQGVSSGSAAPPRTYSSSGGGVRVLSAAEANSTQYQGLQRGPSGPGAAARSCNGAHGVWDSQAAETSFTQHQKLQRGASFAGTAAERCSSSGGGWGPASSEAHSIQQHQSLQRGGSAPGSAPRTCSSGGLRVTPGTETQGPHLQSELSVVSIEDLAACTGASAAAAAAGGGESPSVVELEARLEHLKASFDQVVTFVDAPKAKRVLMASDPGAVMSAKQQQQQGLWGARARSSPGGTGYSQLCQQEQQKQQQGPLEPHVKLGHGGVGYSGLCQQQQQQEEEVSGQGLLTRGESGAQPKDLDIDFVEASLEGGMGGAVGAGVSFARPCSSQGGSGGPVEVSLLDLQEFSEEGGSPVIRAAAVTGLHTAGRQQQGSQRGQDQQQGSVPGVSGQQPGTITEEHKAAAATAAGEGRGALDGEQSSLQCSSISSMDWQHGPSLPLEPSSSQLSSDNGEDLEAITSTAMVDIHGGEQEMIPSHGKSSFLKRQEQQLQKQQRSKSEAKGFKKAAPSRRPQADQQGVRGSLVKAGSGAVPVDAIREGGRRSVPSGGGSNLQQLLASADELTGVSHISTSSSPDHHALLVARQHAKQLQQNNDALLSVLEDDRSTIERLRGQVRHHDSHVSL